MLKYQLSILAIEETKLKNEGIFEITSSDRKSAYKVFHTGNEWNKHYCDWKCYWNVIEKIVGIVIENISMLSSLSSQRGNIRSPRKWGQKKTRES